MSLEFSANQVNEAADVVHGLEFRGAKAHNELFFDGRDQAGIAEGIPAGDIGLRSFRPKSDRAVLEDAAENNGQPLVDDFVSRREILVGYGHANESCH